jgi:CBS domain containing-hemolysin-like protein
VPVYHADGHAVASADGEKAGKKRDKDIAAADLSKSAKKANDKEKAAKEAEKSASKDAKESKGAVVAEAEPSKSSEVKKPAVDKTPTGNLESGASQSKTPLTGAQADAAGTEPDVGGLEVVVAMHFIPDLLLYRTTGRWLLPLLPAIRASLWLVWPFRVFIEGAETLARISEKESDKTDEQRTEEGIEALVEAAEEEGIIEPEQADLIEQVVEFSDKRVREVMTPRPDIVAISAEATLEELHTKFVETGFIRIPVFEKSIDDIVGVAHAQDMLTIADADLPEGKVRQFMKSVLFIPETKVGSELLREMRQKGQTIAVVIDEHGSVAGIATMEDLVEEIMGQSGDQTAEQVGEIIKEPDGAMILPGGLAITEVEELLGIQFGEKAAETVTTLAGLLSHASGKVPAPGDKIDIEGHRFEVLDANQTKVLSVRIRKQKSPAAEATKAKA